MVSAGTIARLDLDPVAVRQDSDGDVADDVLQLFRYAIANDALVLDFLPPRSTDPMHSAQTVAHQHSVRMCCNFPKAARERWVELAGLRLMPPPRTSY